METSACLALLELITQTLVEFALLVLQERMRVILEALHVRHATLDSSPQTQDPNSATLAQMVTRQMASVKPNVFLFAPWEHLKMETSVYLVLLELITQTLVEFVCLVLQERMQAILEALHVWRVMSERTRIIQEALHVRHATLHSLPQI